jgi:hypothetical protein
MSYLTNNPQTLKGDLVVAGSITSLSGKTAVDNEVDIVRSAPLGGPGAWALYQDDTTVRMDWEPAAGGPTNLFAQLKAAPNTAAFAALEIPAGLKKALDADLFTAAPAGLNQQGKIELAGLKLIFGQTAATNAGGDAAVVFDSPYAAGVVPLVLLSVNGNTPDLTSYANSPSNTGFTAHVGTASDPPTGVGGVALAFLAIGPA